MRITIDIDPDQPTGQTSASTSTTATDNGPAALDAGPPSAELVASIAAAGGQYPPAGTSPVMSTGAEGATSGGAAPE